MLINSRLQSKHKTEPLRDHLIVVALVMLVHGSAVLAWVMQPADSSFMLNEMSVSVAMQQADAVQEVSMPESLKPKPEVETEELPLPDEVPKVVASTPLPPVPVVKDVPVSLQEQNSEPDYRADYLNNPRPVYPMLARRLGYSGKVLLNVEVMAEGSAGQILIYASSGHDVLDNAALQAVKGWRFNPARQAGRAITKWFIVPVNFSLEGNKA